MLPCAHDDLCDRKNGFSFISLVMMWKYVRFSGRMDSVLVWYFI